MEVVWIGAGHGPNARDSLFTEILMWFCLINVFNCCMPLGHFPETNGCFNDLSRQMVVSLGREGQELLNATVAEVLFSLIILETGSSREGLMYQTETSMKQGFQ